MTSKEEFDYEESEDFDYDAEIEKINYEIYQLEEYVNEYNNLVDSRDYYIQQKEKKTIKKETTKWANIKVLSQVK